MLSFKKAFEAIHEIGLQAHRSLGVEHFAQEVADVLDEFIGWEYGAVLLLGADGRLEPMGLSRPNERPESLEEDRAYVRSRIAKPRQGLTGWVAEHGQSALLDDVREDSRYFSMRSDIRSELCIPVRIGERTVGVLNTESTRARAFTSKHQQLLELVAVEVAAVVGAEPGARTGTLPSELLVTLCSSCRSYKHADGTWSRVEELIDDAAGLRISHGVCLACLPLWKG